MALQANGHICEVGSLWNEAKISCVAPPTDELVGITVRCNVGHTRKLAHPQPLQVIQWQIVPRRSCPRVAWGELYVFRSCILITIIGCCALVVVVAEPYLASYTLCPRSVWLELFVLDIPEHLVNDNCHTGQLIPGVDHSRLVLL